MKHTIKRTQQIVDGVYHIRLARQGLNYLPGQYVRIHPEKSATAREYSLFSSPDDDDLELLVRTTEYGSVTRQIASQPAGSKLDLKGPCGNFILPEERRNKKILFVSSGMGISPIRSIIRSYPQLDYTLLHGCRNRAEEYVKEDWEPERYIPCLSRENPGSPYYPGRITNYLGDHPAMKWDYVYACGSETMVDQVMKLFNTRDYRPDQLVQEIFY